LEQRAMNSMVQRAREAMERNKRRDRGAERYVEAVSRRLWPWRETWLLAVVGLLAGLDFLSTYAFLSLTGKGYHYEEGVLAGWALRVGGLPVLFLVDLGVVLLVALIAIGVRSLYRRYGFEGFGRAAFVVVLLPYAVMAVAAVINNVVLTSLWA